MLYSPTPLHWLAVLGVSFMLLSLIWIVQLVHYPTFRYIDPTVFDAFHTHHTRSISYIVAPLMILELGLAVWFIIEARGHWTWAVPLALVLFTWANTFFVAVPLHGELAAGLDRDVIERLIHINWWRTVVWTTKAVWVAVLFWRETT